MEKLLHYVWQHRLLPAKTLKTDRGETVDVIDPGLLNSNAGPDFFNAKVKVDGQLWVGNVEIHEHASDWYKHGHDEDANYDNVVLHVCGVLDDTARTKSGRALPQLQIDVPQNIADNYRELLAEEAFPPCYRVIPNLPTLTVHGWLNALTAERLNEKCSRIDALLARTEGDWERTCFITMARNFGFGVNSEAFETWALNMPLSAAGKHRDDVFQVEALFFGQAGLLNDEMVKEERRDAYFLKLQKEYRFLKHKFSLTPMNPKLWRFLRLRPQNFPHIRLAQMVELYHSRRTDFSRLINTVAPLLFAYGRHHFDEDRCEAALDLLEHLKPEQNFITRSWAKAGIKAENAADSQALICLKKNYCDTKDCLRCRFGAEYLRQR